jgi:hypothetical protein
VAFSAVRFGVDDISLGFEFGGLRSAQKLLEEMPGAEQTSGKVLGHRTQMGKWAHLLGRSRAVYRSESTRLYVQAKLADPNELCAPDRVAGAVAELVARLEAMGLASWQEPWVTRLDVAVDATCAPEDGKRLLDALEAARLPRAWRTTSVGVPRSTVYFKAAKSENVLARSYCRNLRLKKGRPFGLIRLEAQQRWGPRETMLAAAASPPFIGRVWRSRFAELTSQVTRVPDDVQASRLGELMRRGELRHGAAERMNLFLSLERLGRAVECYPPKVYAARRREAVQLGLAASDEGQPALDICLGELLRPYVEAVDLALAA